MKKKRRLIGIVLVAVVTLGLLGLYLAKKPVTSLVDEVKWDAAQIKNDFENGKINPEFQAYFDRDPERTVPKEPNIIVAPADGKVLSISNDDNNYTMMIRLTLFDVHVQRVPISGRVVSVEKVGDKIVSSKDPQVVNNVQTITTLATRIGPVVIKQITSPMTKKIETYVKPGQEVAIGERLGRIVLGSTVIITLPKGIDVLVKEGEQIYGSETVLASYK